MTALTPNFTLEELTFSEVALRKGIDNTPPDFVVENLKRLCSLLLEPARSLLAVPLHVNSGYRSLAVNEAVGGATNSAHMNGCAADIVPIGMGLQQAFATIKASDLDFDQLIFECGAWLHLSIAEVDQPTRKECLMASGAPGHWVYSRVN